MYNRLFAASFVALVFIGCGWGDDSRYANAVFSEDGQGIAVVYQEFESKNAFTYIKRRKFRSKILLTDESSLEYREASDVFEGDVLDLFFQRDAGYLLVGRQGDPEKLDDGSAQNWVAYDLINLNTGQRRALDRITGISSLSCDGGNTASMTPHLLRMIPSPSGDYIARFSSTSSCVERSYSVSFIDAETLEPTGGEVTIREPVTLTMYGTTSYWPILDLAWTDDGYFGVSDWRNNTLIDHVATQLYSPEADAVQARQIHYECLTIPTLSSFRRPDGREVWVDEESGELFFNPMGVESGFGCVSL